MGSSYDDRMIRCSNPNFGNIRIAGTDLNFSKDCKLVVSIVVLLIIISFKLSITLILKDVASQQKNDEEIQSISCAYINKLPAITQIVRNEKEAIWKLQVFKVFILEFYL